MHTRRLRPATGEADDGGRTRDLRLGKPTLYQLSYVRAARSLPARRVRPDADEAT